jgi:iron(III) transport system substrate-binding protein
MKASSLVPLGGLLLGAGELSGDALVKAAQAEGQIVPYEGFSSEIVTAMADSFTKKYGIPNRLFRAGQEALQTRIEAGLRAGQVLADIESQDDVDVTNDMWDRKLIVDYRPTTWDHYQPAWRFPRTNTITFAISASAICYNTKLVAPGDAPKSYEDFASPKWKGQVALPSPEYAGTAVKLISFWVKTHGWDFIRALKRNDVFIAQAASDSENAVISGQKMIGITTSFHGAYDIGKGAPIKLAWSTGGTMAYGGVHLVLKGAAHPNAAKLYVDYCLSMECQRILVQYGMWSALEGAPQPEHLPALKDIKLTQADWQYIAKNRTEIMDGWRNIMASG